MSSRNNYKHLITPFSMLKNYVFLVGAWLLLSQPLAAQNTFNLQEAINYGLQNHPSKQRNKLAIADSEASIKEFKAIGMPKLNAKVGYNYFVDIPTQILPDFISPVIDGRLQGLYGLQPQVPIPPYGSGLPAQFGTKNSLNLGLDANMLVFDGSYVVGLQAVKLAKELASRQAILSDDSIKVNIKKSYLAILAAQKNKEVIAKNIQNLTATYNQINEIYKSGFAEKLDADRLALSIQTLNAEGDKLNRLTEILKNVLKFHMNYPMENDIVLTENFDTVVSTTQAGEADLVQKNNLENRREYQLLSTVEELQKLNIKRYRYSYYPTMVVFASHSQNLQRNKFFDKNENPFFPTTVVGFNITAGIFDGFDKKMKTQRAKIAVENVQLTKSVVAKAMDLEITNANLQYQNARATIAARQEALSMAERIFNTTQIKFKEGVGSSLEVTTAERDLYSAQAGYINALYDLIVARVDWEKAMGKL